MCSKCAVEWCWHVLTASWTAPGGGVSACVPTPEVGGGVSTGCSNSVLTSTRKPCPPHGICVGSASCDGDGQPTFP
eukprot:2950043-Prymnesium_polylepis.1